MLYTVCIVVSVAPAVSYCWCLLVRHHGNTSGVRTEGGWWSIEPPDLCILFESLSLRKEGEGNYRMGASEV